MGNKLDLIKLAEHNGNVVTTSLNVSEIFSKEHKNVLKDIRDIMEKWDEIDGLNFEPVKKDEYFIDSSYVDAKGESRKVFLITKKGAARLIMGYTGLDAERYKVEYIERFETMEKALKEIKDAVHNKPSHQHKYDIVSSEMAAWMRLATIFKTPEHYALIEGAKVMKKEYDADLLPLIKESASMDNINEDDKLLEVTELAKLVGLGNKKGRIINEFLCTHGYQVKVNGYWEPTDKGKPYSEGHSWTNGIKSGYNYKWKQNWFLNLYNQSK